MTPRELYPNLVNPPHDYYDVRNRIGSSPFRPGLQPEAYNPFLEYFDERAQTAEAQVRLDIRKGRVERAHRYAQAAAGWRRAARMVLRRKRSAMAAQDLARVIDTRMSRGLQSPAPAIPKQRDFEW